MNYYFDGSHLYVRVENTDDEVVQQQNGFSWSTSWGCAVDIVASCSTCDVGGAIGAVPNPPLPAPFIDRTDKYEVTRSIHIETNTTQVDLAAPGCSNTKSGHGFFSWDSTSHVLYYSIEHNVGPAASSAVITDGTFQLQLNSALSPIRGYLSLSESKSLKLWAGNLSLQIGTGSTVTVSGTIGCVGSCSTPAKIPSGDLCTVAGSSIVLYEDALAAGWSSWSWGNATSANFKDTTAAHCGTASISFNWNSGSALSLHNDNNVAIDPAVYTHVELFMKTASGSVLVMVSFNDGDWYTVQSSEIVNYVVEDAWTRIRVPLSEIPLTGAISRVSFASPWYGDAANIYIDEIRFVTDSATDTLVDPVSGTAAPYQANPNSCTTSSSGTPGGNNDTGGDGDSMSSASSFVASFALIVIAIFAML